MPVHPLTYVYLILSIADALCLIVSLIKRDGLIEVFAPCLFMFIIGYFCNRYAIQAV